MQADSKFSGALTVLCIGACLGTLTAATMYVSAAIMIVFIAPVLIVPYVGWGIWACCMRSIGRLRSFSPALAIFLTIVGVPACGYLPYGVASLELILRAQGIPEQGDLEVSRITPDPIGNATTGPGIVYHLEPSEEVLPALRELQGLLVDDGWRVVAGSVPSARGSNVRVLLGGPTGRSLGLYASWNRTLHVYENIAIRQNFSPWSPPVFLLVQIAAGVISVAYSGRRQRKSEN